METVTCPEPGGQAQQERSGDPGPGSWRLGLKGQERTGVLWAEPGHHHKATRRGPAVPRAGCSRGQRQAGLGLGGQRAPRQVPDHPPSTWPAASLARAPGEAECHGGRVWRRTAAQDREARKQGQLHSPGTTRHSPKDLLPPSPTPACSYHWINPHQWVNPYQWIPPGIPTGLLNKAPPRPQQGGSFWKLWFSGGHQPCGA